MVDISLKQLYDEKYIEQGNILLYNRIYKDVKFTYECKIKDIYEKKFLVVLTSAENMEMLCNSLIDLELYILHSDIHFKDILLSTENPYDWFSIKDKDVIKGSITELKNQYVKDNTAKELGERKLYPILDPYRSKFFDKVKNNFWIQFKKFSFSYVCEALVDDKEAIIVFMDQLEEASVHLPAKFEGFPVFISYEVFQLH
ncbi:hypothetical protein RhiirA5_371206 [Rhizophagus irregularis]|uniref:Uncharacterized protein n=1 Tax=Rhizophagus irregularis TaxID=588596 RepID=A0A2I1EJX7_9GLOM|nr:hypothetical protein RhiirA5_423585 [Rhizophagus irregularis]PKC14751.1 hypothetical protein RhiirA5_371206 [Rhizophagus irregularis]PKC66535.1 hypothetical protein RhiirA1_459573 [Rhizophagus irregularis]PKY22426.1 hypothetical protein RhiirB3_503203 [Rhizophagus irregularis]CAB4483210.1 unnamed protein product [Rhizophagus irregularis]